MTRKPHLSAGLLTILGVIATIGAFATDMYLASFTDITESLGVSPSQVQLTLTAFLTGMGLGQLLLGPASDKYGRRRVMVLALGVFALTSIALVFTPNIGYFVALRFVQGLSGAAGGVLARAIAVDLSEGDTAVRALSLIATVIGLGPLLAPPIGGLIAELLGWRGVLAVLAAFAITVWLMAVVAVPESLPEEHRAQGSVLGAYKSIFTILTKPVFLLCTISFSFGFGAMMSYIAASPFVGQSILRMGQLSYALSFALSASAIILANILNARLAVQHSVVTMFRAGAVLLVLAAASFVVMETTDTLTIPGFVATAFILTAGAGLTMSNANALGLAEATPSTRGAGAAVMGAAQFLLASLVSPLVGLAGETSATPMVVVIAVLVGVSVLSGGLARLRLAAR
jgi:DHA1 family bicyclomycin/chloramphenicol resistance-like MFS transporter